MTLDEVIEKASLSAREAAILKTFIDADGHRISMSQLARKVGEMEDGEPPYQALRINIKSMNSKFLTNDTGHAVIMTSGGKGRGLIARYVLTSRVPMERDPNWKITRIMEWTGIAPGER